MRWRHIDLFVLLISLILFSLPVHGRANHDRQAEYLVKAAFIYRFALFVEWPSEAFNEPKSPLRLCILGEDPFGNAIETIEGQMIKSHKLSVKLCKTITEAKECHILFISDSERENLRQILNHIEGLHLLTITETPEAAQKGVIINLIKVGDKVRFEINLDAAERSNLKIRSQLLSLAKIIREKAAKDSGQ